MFGVGFLKHAIFCFTHWRHTAESKRNRERQGVSLEAKQQEFYEELVDTLDAGDFFYENAPPLSVFVDSVVVLGHFEYGDKPEDMDDQRAALDMILQVARNTSVPFSCESIEAVKARERKLGDQIDEMHEQIKKKEAQAKADLEKADA